MDVTYVGKLCTNNHDDGTGQSVRYKSSRNCVSCLRDREQTEEYKAKSKQWRDTHKVDVRERGIRWRAENTERKRENDRAYYADNKERVKSVVKEYRENNTEKVRALQSAYTAKTKEKKKSYDRPYRNIRKYGLTQRDKEGIFNRQYGKCAICFKQWDNAWVYDCCVDHFDKEDGSPVVRYLLCRACNGAIGQFNHNPKTLRRAAMYCQMLTNDNPARNDYIALAFEQQ